MIEETTETGDWLKIPSDLFVKDPKGFLERAGATDTPLYRRLVEDPDFEKKKLSEKEAK